jgi:hypothetical protein
MSMEKLPIHPFTGLTAVGVLPSGRIVWPIRGGSGDPEPEPAPEPDPEPEAEPEPDPDTPLGPAGEKALAAEKAKRKEAEAKNRAARERIAELERGGDEAAKEKAEIEKAAMARANARLVRAEVKAAAAGVLADPNDAAQFLDLASFEVGEDGEVDADEVKAAIADLVKKKPYLGVSTARFQGGADQGARKKQAGPSLDDQITEAEKARNFPLAIALKRQRAAAQAAQTK